MRHLGSWVFAVFADDNGDIVTEWSVVEWPGQAWSGKTLGPLPLAIFDAYDAVGLVCPMTIEPDLAKMAGHEIMVLDDGPPEEAT